MPFIIFIIMYLIIPIDNHTLITKPEAQLIFNVCKINEYHQINYQPKCPIKNIINNNNNKLYQNNNNKLYQNSNKIMIIYVLLMASLIIYKYKQAKYNNECAIPRTLLFTIINDIDDIIRHNNINKINYVNDNLIKLISHIIKTSHNKNVVQLRKKLLFENGGVYFDLMWCIKNKSFNQSTLNKLTQIFYQYTYYLDL